MNVDVDKLKRSPFWPIAQVALLILAVALSLSSYYGSDETAEPTARGTTHLSGLEVSGDETDTLVVDQIGTGDIYEFRDNGTVVQRLADGGTLTHTGAFDVIGTLTSDDVTITGTLSAEQVTSTDDADIQGDLLANTGTITGALTVGGGYGSTGCTVSAAGALSCDGDLAVNSNFTVTATSGNVASNGTLSVDTIAERTAAAGVTVDGLTIMDGALDETFLEIGDISGAGNSTKLQIDDANSSVYIGDVEEAGSLTLLTIDDNGSIISLQAQNGIFADTSALYAFRPYTAKTVSFTVPSNRPRTVYSNQGASGAITFTLPVASSGWPYCFYTYAAQTIYVDPAAGDQIHHLTNATGDRISNSTVGDSICLLAVDSTYWIPLHEVGTWADAN